MDVSYSLFNSHSMRSQENGQCVCASATEKPIDVFAVVGGGIDGGDQKTNKTKDLR